jgi:single-strand DNA-binding protein
MAAGPVPLQPSNKTQLGVNDMALCINKVFLLGKVGKDPEIKKLPSGADVAIVTLATLDRYKDKSGEWQDRIESHNVTAYGEMYTKVLRTYVKKGSQICIEGKLQNKSWDDKQTGQKRFRTEVVVIDLVLLGDTTEKNERHNEGDRGGRTAQKSRDQSPPPNKPPFNGDRPRPRGNGYDSLPGYKNRVQPMRPNGAAAEPDDDYFRTEQDPA